MELCTHRRMHNFALWKADQYVLLLFTKECDVSCRNTCGL